MTALIRRLTPTPPRLPSLRILFLRRPYPRAIEGGCCCRMKGRWPGRRLQRQQWPQWRRKISGTYFSTNSSPFLLRVTSTTTYIRYRPRVSAAEVAGENQWQPENVVTTGSGYGGYNPNEAGNSASYTFNDPAGQVCMYIRIIRSCVCVHGESE